MQDVPPGLDDAGADEYAGIATAIADFARTADKPVTVLSLLGAGLHSRAAVILDAAAVPVLRRGAPGMAALALTRRSATAPPAGLAIPPQPDWLARLSTGPALTEREAKDFLDAYGIPTTREALATSAEQAATIASGIGFPVAMKVESADILHKTEAGGVRLGIADVTAARAAFADILTTAHHCRQGRGCACSTRCSSEPWTSTLQRPRDEATKRKACNFRNQLDHALRFR